jgi:hypothetical protein
MNIKIPSGTERLYFEKLVEVQQDEITGLIQDRAGLQSALKIYNELETELNRRVDEANKEIMEKEIEIKHLKRELNMAKKGKKAKAPAKKKVEPKEPVFAGIESTPIEEITIPTGDELRKMPKAKVVQAAKKLGFDYDMKQPKHLMIEKFEEDTEDFIEQLKKEGSYVQETTEDMDGGTY